MSWKDQLPEVRGKLMRDEPLAPFTWFRVGGPADAEPGEGRQRLAPHELAADGGQLLAPAHFPSASSWAGKA